jgi:penicillin G amidase
MSFVFRCMRGLCMALFILALATIYGLYFAYEVKVEGELVLKNAPEDVTVVREADTQILHIKAKTWEGISYGQGFSSAQNRLWQMEKTRRLGKGKLSELFGELALPIDEFMRNVGLERSSKETWDINKDELLAKVLTAYSNGVNDYVQGVSLMGEEPRTARLLPPEFLVFGVNKQNFEAWTPVDCLLTIRII